MTRNHLPFGKLPKITDDDRHTAKQLIERINGEITLIKRDITALENQILGLETAREIIEQSVG